MNIDCKVDQVEIASKCIQDINTYNLGTQSFFESVHEITIDYTQASSKPEIDKDLDSLYMHFKNLNSITLEGIESLTIDEIIGILKNWKINNITFSGTMLDKEYSLESDTGSLVLYDCKDHHYINFSSICLDSHSSHCKTQGEYVIFDYEYSKLRIDGLKISKICKEYDILDLKSIKE